MDVKKTCLVVDDSSVIRQIAVRIISNLGLEPAEADSAVDAVEYCRNNKPAVVLLDWDLPSMGALDFLRGAASFPEEEKPEIILCATENDPQQFTLAKAAGAQHHVLKPFDKEVLADKFREIGLITGDVPKSAANQ